MLVTRRCPRCQRWRPVWHFRWHDRTGRHGWARRCQDCRQHRGRQRDPNLPEPRYRIRLHAIERYRERVNPDLTRTKARDEMIRRMVAAPLVTEPPSWLNQPRRGRFSIGYLIINDDLVFCIRSYPTGRGTSYEKISTVMTRRPESTFPTLSA